MNIDGYETFTTFWQDFSIADHFGTDAITDTYRRAFNGWRHDYHYLTELVLILNWKCWSYHEKNEAYCELYANLYENARDWAYDNLTGEALDYFYRITD